MVDANEVKNTATALTGKAKEAAGKVTGNDDLRVEGQIDRAKATARKNSENEHDLFG